MVNNHCEWDCRSHWLLFCECFVGRVIVKVWGWNIFKGYHTPSMIFIKGFSLKITYLKLGIICRFCQIHIRHTEPAQKWDTEERPESFTSWSSNTHSKRNMIIGSKGLTSPMFHPFLIWNKQKSDWHTTKGRKNKKISPIKQSLTLSSSVTHRC